MRSLRESIADKAPLFSYRFEVTTDPSTLCGECLAIVLELSQHSHTELESERGLFDTQFNEEKLSSNR